MSDENPADNVRPLVVVQRLLPMNRERLFTLWTDPIHLARWWGPAGWRVTRCEVDLRLGGEWRTWLLTARGEERSIGGRYLEIESPQRLVFTWEFPESNPGALPQVTVVTVTFEARGSSTLLAIEHRKLSSGQSVDMDIGWTSTLESLANYLATL